MRKPKKIDRDFFGAYYMSDKPCNIWGTNQTHCYPCGIFTFEGAVKCLSFVRLSTQILAVTNSGNEEKIEHFDLSLSDADEIAKDLMFQMAVSGAEFEVTEALMTRFSASVAQLIAWDLQQGLSFYEVFTKRAALLVNQFMGFTFEEVLFNYPGILVETVTTDNEGNESTANIWRNSQENAQ